MKNGLAPNIVRFEEKAISNIGDKIIEIIISFFIALILQKPGHKILSLRMS